MDNLTHSLIGAALGQAGLKRKTGLAMPALIIAANLPDIDAPAALMGIESLAIRRGITHGPIALVVLPLLLAWGLLWWDRRQARRGTRPEARLPVRFGWLLALCYLGALTHPFFDWLNSYGVRLLEPFSHQWFYGDALFIIDPWIILLLWFGVWRSRRDEREGEVQWRLPAIVALIIVAAYVWANLAITASAVKGVPGVAVANPVLLQSASRDILVRFGPDYGSSRNGVGSDYFFGKPTNMSDPRIAEWAKNDPQAQAFLFWSRMPIAELHPDRIVLRDQRFMGSFAGDRFSVTLRPPQ